MPLADYKDIIEAAITTAGVAVTAGASIYAAYTHNKRKQTEAHLKLAKDELGARQVALNFLHYTSAWAIIQQEVLDIFHNTCFDRFILFRAWNGVLDPEWTTAMIQLRDGGQQPYSFIHVDLDHDYNMRLQTTRKNGFLELTADELPDDSLIGEIYKAEGVTHSLWKHIADYDFEGGSTAIMYFSLSTHAGREPTDAERVRARLLASRLRALASNEPNIRKGSIVDEGD